MGCHRTDWVRNHSFFVACSHYRPGDQFVLTRYIHALRRTTLLVLGSYADTRALRVAISSGTSAEQPVGFERDIDVEEVSVYPFADPVAATATTVFAGVVENLLVQVRSDGVAYSGPGETSARHWAPESGRKITAADTGTAPDGTGLLIVAIEGGELVVAARSRGGGELISLKCVPERVATSARFRSDRQRSTTGRKSLSTT